MQQAEILLATCNGGKYLAQQLDSLLKQTWPAWHLTASDDGSTDDTPAILAQYAARYPDRITLLNHGKHFGNARDHFFYLLQQTAAPYILFCDQDDVWNPDKVEITMEALLAEEAAHGADTPLLVFTDQTPTDESLTPTADSLMRIQKQDASTIDYRRILLQNIVTGCACGINQALARLAGQITCTGDVIMHDWWLAAVAARFGMVRYIDQSTMLYRQHGDNTVGAKDVSKLSYILGKLAKPAALRRQILNKKQQAARLLADYAGMLTPEDTAFLETYAKPRSGPGFYWKHRALFNGTMRFLGTFFLG